jgi:hypothetical protein
MSEIIRDEKLIRIAKSVKPDSKKRIVLPKILIKEDISYRVYYNSLGQIILDPEVTIPASEVWLFENPDSIASVRRGLADAANGKVSKVDLDNL